MPRIAVRADASLQIGSGHVMRCLALANALRDRGGDCHFICRTHRGHLSDMILDQGFMLHTLPPGAPDFVPSPGETKPEPAHAAWLGCPWHEDAIQTAEVLERLQPDWLVVDHYAIDARWHAVLAPHHGKLLVIDDLADRPHLSDVLLDQTYGRDPRDYRHCVPAECMLLCGSQYALLRPEFAMLREQSLQRRTTSNMKQLLITMGGVDKDNVTCLVLDALKGSRLPPSCEITVVMGGTAPWLSEVRTRAASLPWPARVLTNVQDMAAVMANADLCIGAAGSTAWERCTLGIPSLLIVTAANQSGIAAALHKSGAALCIGSCTTPSLAERLHAGIARFVSDPPTLNAASAAAAAVTDGTGVQVVCRALLEDVMS